MLEQSSLNQQDLFSTTSNSRKLANGDTRQVIEIDDGELYYYPRWLPKAEADQYYNDLLQAVVWQQTYITLYGKTLPVPRLNAWYGDIGSIYTYSGARFTPLPWLVQLGELRTRLHSLGYVFNSALANYYRNGADSVAWHSDDEPELGDDPVVAAITLGQPRRFMLRHRTRDLPTLTLTPEHGSLLVMGGSMQRHWHHQVPKTQQMIGGRINITFRQIKHSQ